MLNICSNGLYSKIIVQLFTRSPKRDLYFVQMLEEMVSNTLYDISAAQSCQTADRSMHWRSASDELTLTIFQANA